MNPRKILAEFLGTLFLVFVAIGVLATDQLLGITDPNRTGLLGISLTLGFTVAALVSVFGPISGGHLNPAVTIAALIGRKVDPLTGILYLVAQVLGGLGGAYMVGQVFDYNAVWNVRFGLPQIDDAISPMGALLAEAMFMFIIVGAYFGARFFVGGAKAGALTVGFSFAAASLALGDYTGGLVNPARWLGSGFFYKSDFSTMSIHLLGPVVGAILGGLIFGYLFSDTGTVSDDDRLSNSEAAV